MRKSHRLLRNRQPTLRKGYRDLRKSQPAMRKSHRLVRSSRPDLRNRHRKLTLKCSILYTPGYDRPLAYNMRPEVERVKT